MSCTGDGATKWSSVWGKNNLIFKDKSSTTKYYKINIQSNVIGKRKNIGICKINSIRYLLYIN